MTWIDRISGAASTCPSLPYVPGQWLFSGEGQAIIRESTVIKGDVTLPDADGKMNIHGHGVLRTDSRLVLDDDALRYMRLIGTRLDALNQENWFSWLDESPLVTDLQDALDEQPLERDVKKNIGFLEAVCLRPKTHLMLEEERLLVSRCKRPSSRAPMVLSARSEDWERRTLWGVRPRRILGVVRDDLFDIYENRVAVSLVNHLDVALRKRIRDVRRVVDLLQRKEDYQELLENTGNYLRAKRILQLWADALNDNTHLNDANKVLQKLKGLRRRVLALKDSPLYQKIGRANVSGLELKLTNVMKHDETYRRMGELWIAWENHVRESIPDPDERWLKEQKAVEGFFRFSFLVVVRALDNLGYEPNEVFYDQPLNEVGEWKLDGPLGSLSLIREKSKIILKLVSSGETLAIVPLPSMLEASPSIGGWIESLPEDERRRLILSVTADEPRALPKDKLRLRSLGNQGEASGLMFSSIAPWDLESVERVTRAIRWFVWSDFYGAYPFEVHTGQGWEPPNSVPDWLRVSEGKAFLVKPLQTGGSAWPNLDERFERSKKEVHSLNIKLTETKGTRDRLHIKKKLDETQISFLADEITLRNIKSASSLLKKLLNCPICQKSNSPYSFEEAGGLFRCSCDGCNSYWGLRGCDNCGSLYPFLNFPGNDPSSDFLNVDRRYGSDILAVPLNDQEYLCPDCGVVEAD